MFGDWFPGIGDPTPAGWITVVAYFVAAGLCVRAAGKGARPNGFWVALAIAMTLLGLNKQLDLQSLLTEIGRTLARSEHWYGERRAVQKAFILGIATLGFAISAGLVWHARRHALPVRIAGFGIASLAAFIVIRAASFHHVDRFLGSPLLMVRWNVVLELAGIAIIAGAAAAAPGLRTR